MKLPNFEHQFVSESDYIASPRDSGYRGVHLIYRSKYRRAPAYDGLQIELQFRTRIQHIWATAVETVGTFLKQSLKSSEGSGEWLSFFSPVGSAFAILEECPPIERHRAELPRDIFATVLEEAEKLQVHRQLSAYRVGLDVASKKLSIAGGGPSAFHLFILNLDTRRLGVTAYSKQRLGEAIAQYETIEKEINDGRNAQAVLVSAGSLKALKRAYPNYFGDTTEFVKLLDSMK
jgi:putative GTP pyrophosphokinase